MSSNKGKVQSSDSAARIEYSGFKDMDESDMVQIRKAAQDFAEKISGHGFGFDRLALRLKEIHKVDHNQKFEFHVEVNKGTVTRAAECTDKNPFKALDLALKSLLVELNKTR